MIKILSFVIIFLFALLLYKDPFSERSLIPNFEPYPDTFNYIDPALNFVRGKGFNLNREGRVRIQAVPPLYSFSFIPAFIVKPDPRMTYYVNVLLSFTSLLIFWLILNKIFKNIYIKYLLLILYITNYFIYWVPSLVMAENLTLTLFLAAIFFLQSKVTLVNLISLSALAVASYATKYANIPTTLIIICLTSAKIIFNNLVFKKKIKLLLFFLAFILLFFVSLAVFENVNKGNNIFSQIFEHVTSIYKSVPNASPDSQIVVSSSSWFGIQYIEKNLPLYLSSIMGNSNRFLWDNTPIVPKFLAIMGLSGILAGIFTKKIRFIAISLLLFISSSVIFISSFYTFDARYIYIAIPSLLLGCGLILAIYNERISLNKRIVLNAAIIIFIIIYLIINFNRIKSQISLNLRYAETPWYYVSVLKMNEYFTSERIVNNKKLILISALPPFLIDYYSNGNYILLPLSYEQEFRNYKEIIWGPNDYSDLPALYTKYINEGYEVYVSRAGLGNESYTNRDFNIITQEFDTRLVLPGCFEQCNIYSVKLKDEKSK